MERNGQTSLNRSAVFLALACGALACGHDQAGFESTPLTCADRQDNDGDGLIDCADPECRGEVVCDPIWAPPDGGGETDSARAPDPSVLREEAGAPHGADARADLDADGATEDAPAAEETDGGLPAEQSDAGLAPESGDASFEASAVPDLSEDAQVARFPDAGADAGEDADVCASVQCQTPPLATCGSSDVLIQFASTGRCVGGRCVYEPREARCPHGCDAARGACANDPCAGVLCVDPPASACLSDVLLATYGGGRCVEGQCAYAGETLRCPYGCRAGACLPKPIDPCEGVRCASPPRAACRDRTTRTTYGELGKCVQGRCVYPSRDQSCDAPPANVCRDARSLLVYSAKGGCTAGTCSYASTVLPCPYGCAGSRCLARLTKPPLGVTRPL